MEKLRSKDTTPNTIIADQLIETIESRSSKKTDSKKKSCIIYDSPDEIATQKMEGLKSADLYTPRQDANNDLFDNQEQDFKDKTNVRIKKESNSTINELLNNQGSIERTNIRITKESNSTIKRFQQILENSVKKVDTYQLFDNIELNEGKNFLL